MNKSIIWSLVLLIIVAAVYRVIPGRPFGFAPHLAMALFAGAMIKDRKWAFALPVFSMFFSDILYQVLYSNGLTDIPGFYKGQVVNYLLFAGVTCIGFLMKQVNVWSIFTYSLLVPSVYFLASNFIVWSGGGGLRRPKTFSGLIQCYVDGLPFYQVGLLATIAFSIVLFGGYYLINKSAFKIKAQGI